ncbi:hypothetical protein GX553_03565 [Candidatus Peribacteria bacterium]|nr:hypothetical protein [Candidatus Peribacteria bacterium]
MSEEAEIFDDLQLLKTQCGISYRQVNAMPDAVQRRILAALDTYKSALAAPEGDLSSARERLRETVEAEKEAMKRARRE